jgi:hypothetical protein
VVGLAAAPRLSVKSQQHLTRPRASATDGCQCEVAEPSGAADRSHPGLTGDPSGNNQQCCARGGYDRREVLSSKDEGLKVEQSLCTCIRADDTH